MRLALAVELTDEQRTTLESWAKGRKTPVLAAERARVVLLAAEGKRDVDIAEALSITAQKAARWRRDFWRKALSGLEKDAPRPGRIPLIGVDKVAEIVRLTTQSRPEGATNWSTRSMAEAVGVSDTSVLRIWHAYGLKPHRIATFKVSNDPQFSEELEAVAGLYLSPPEHALVLGVEEKSQMQALDLEAALATSEEGARRDDDA